MSARVLLPVVNEKDRIIGYKPRAALEKSDVYRASAIWITHSQNKILLAQRAFSKKNGACQWGPAVAGTVEKGETYLRNALKEAREELGLENVSLVKGPKQRIRVGANFFCQWYFLIRDKEVEDFALQKSEVEKVEWFSSAEIWSMFGKNPSFFISNASQWIPLLVEG